ncbi:MAG: hypothetical protein UX09_C0055G0011 [Candidatus Uhrbacteria bacterium GW2011_GWE2_45_35]|uniref:Uncharacterized protein n=2 Tax=Candidatus Uhriibacteriota TaxID=1752732 RepID=A0A0G1JCD8_9BACT|nr:MAG: hypothetical protein UW63_C0064G0011 [Candidatus Uhrbacteria bacterium GW2011_GWF2_44_350]KKU06267.1 MAG: hypothetical protein UX09_C0055G0011 [Candidatus Uhrbacteria bacterium GW2011_GWE2_45_35]HBR80445.1 hypothetical protein [Candidatus Uhrbacteria bacterium]HCU31432.1 hypothetical protein [Candidatus Uhrbacteria bacterium]
MKDFSKKLKLRPETKLTPLAVNFSDKSLVSILVSTKHQGKTFFTVLNGPNFDPTGWVADKTVIESLITKHNFKLLTSHEHPPQITLNKTLEGKEILTKWLKEKDKQK